MDVYQVLKVVAPWLASAVGGPLGGVAVTAIANALGLSEKTEGAIKQALAGVTPEQMLAIKVAEQDFALKMQEIGFANERDMEALAAGDRDSARKREIEVKDNTPRNLAYIITGGYFGIIALLLLGISPTENKEILFTLLGTLGTVWVGITGYYYGTTAGSAKKTELLANSTPAKDVS